MVFPFEFDKCLLLEKIITTVIKLEKVSIIFKLVITMDNNLTVLGEYKLFLNNCKYSKIC